MAVGPRPNLQIITILVDWALPMQGAWYEQIIVCSKFGHAHHVRHLYLLDYSDLECFVGVLGLRAIVGRLPLRSCSYKRHFLLRHWIHESFCTID